LISAHRATFVMSVIIGVLMLDRSMYRAKRGESQHQRSQRFGDV
jgi:hypothetical protein